MDGSVHQHPAHEAADLLHAGELGPLVRVGVVALHAAQDRLVLAEPAANVDPPLVSNNRTTEARYSSILSFAQNLVTTVRNILSRPVLS